MVCRAEGSTLAGVTRNDWQDATDEELEDGGMWRCTCGEAVYPNGDPAWRHCPLDRR